MKLFREFPGGSDSKEFACKAADSFVSKFENTGLEWLKGISLHNQHGCFLHYYA